MAKHLLTGIKGEERAAAYLQSLGYKVQERNVRFGRDEIDLIAYDPTEQMMVFVEVKTRARSSTAYPIETSVDARKRRCLRRAIAAWTIKHDYDGPGRIDVLCVSGDKVLKHVQDLGAEY